MPVSSRKAGIAQKRDSGAFAQKGNYSFVQLDGMRNCWDGILSEGRNEKGATAGLRIVLRPRRHPEEAKPTKDLSAAFLTELAGQSRRCSFQVHRRHDRGTVSCARGRLPSSAGSAGRERTIRESMYWNKYEILRF